MNDEMQWLRGTNALFGVIPQHYISNDAFRNLVGSYSSRWIELYGNFDAVFHPQLGNPEGQDNQCQELKVSFQATKIRLLDHHEYRNDRFELLARLTAIEGQLVHQPAGGHPVRLHLWFGNFHPGVMVPDPLPLTIVPWASIHP